MQKKIEMMDLKMQVTSAVPRRVISTKYTVKILVSTVPTIMTPSSVVANEVLVDLQVIGKT